jgi:PPOX class probable F420-dependent enzyme
VTPHQARRRFAAARVARLATADAAGRPHIVPVTFAVDGDVVYSAVDAKPKRGTALKRLANVAANPAVALLVDHYADDWNELWWVRADGTGRVVDPEDPRAYAPCRCSPTATRASPRAGPCSPSTYTAGQAGRRRPRPRKAEMALPPIDRVPPRADCSACARQRTAASKTICAGPMSRLAGAPP